MRAIVKNIYSVIIMLLALPFGLFFIVAGKLAALCGAYSDLSIIVSRFPFMFGEKVRFLYYKGTLKHLGNGVVFKYGSFCQYPNASIGDRVLIGYYNAVGEITMGNDIIIGGFVNFISGTSQHSFEDDSQTISEQKSAGRTMITIGSDVWIGSNAVIAANVGSRCVVGAGAVLVKPATDRGVYGGNPAKLIKTI